MRVMIVDDHAMVRQSLVQALQGEPGLEIAGEASNGAAAVELAGRLRPDVVLMDVVMPQMDGIEATRRIARDYPEIRVIGLSVHDSMTYAARMLEAGACAYLLKDCNMEDLVREIYWGDRPTRHFNDSTRSKGRAPTAAR